MAGMHQPSDFQVFRTLDRTSNARLLRSSTLSDGLALAHWYRDEAEILGYSDPGHHTPFFEYSLAVVEKQEVTGDVVGDVEVGVTVAVEVACGDGQALCGVSGHARCDGNIDEATPIVA